MRFNWYRQCWYKLWDALGAKGDKEDWFLRIVIEWMRGDRVYHDIDHLGEGLIEFNSVRRFFNDPLAGELTYWLHDVIYDPHKALGENERLSADLAIEFLKAVGLFEKYGDRIEKMIIASTPGVEPFDKDSELILDIDMIRFAAEPSKFWQISQLVRDEYHFVSDKEYEKNRAMILHMFADRGHVFRTKRFRKKYEVEARRNIKTALERLEKPAE